MGRKTASDKHIIQNRIRIVQEWLLMDYPSADIISQGKDKWGVTERQMYRYMSSAEEGFLKMLQNSVDKKRAWHIQRRKKAIRDVEEKHKKTPKGLAAVNKTLDSIARIEGLFVEKHEHKVDMGDANILKVEIVRPKDED